MNIRPYAADDEPHLVALWNASMWADPIDAASWRTRYLLDPNFAAEDCLVALEPAGGGLVGFVLGMSTKVAGNRTLQPPGAWVVAFGVSERHRRQGVATALFDRLEAGWRATGLGKVTVGPYIPGYVTPGVDEVVYAGAIQFLHNRGAETANRPLSMKVSLTGYRPAADVGNLGVSLARSGIRVRPADTPDILPLLEFIDQHFPHWRPDATAVLQELFGADPRAVTMHVAEEQGRIIGYAQSRGERFGPFGVDETFRGRGIGAVLLSGTLLAMRARGFHCAWFLWTSDRAAKLYREHGFEEVRRFALMTTNLDVYEEPGMSNTASDAPCIMVIGAHAADAELMGGAAVLAHHRLGWRSVLVHMTLGEKGSKTLSAEAYMVQKREEAARAAAILGSSVEVLPYLDGELPVNDTVQWQIADLIRKHRPDVILTHWKGSIHTDHTNTYENVLASLFFAGLKTFVREYPNHYPRAIYFAENWEDEEDFVPDTYLDVTADWDTYVEAASSYTLIAGPNPPFRYLQWYDGASRARGAERHMDRAVALMPYRPFYSRRRAVERLG